MSREPVEQQDSKGESQGDCVPLYNRKGEKALKMQDETGIIPLKINLLVRASFCCNYLHLGRVKSIMYMKKDMWKHQYMETYSS